MFHLYVEAGTRGRLSMSARSPRPVVQDAVDPAFLNVRPYLMGETRFFVFVVGKPFKKTVWSRHLFLFYFKGEKQNKK